MENIESRKLVDSLLANLPQPAVVSDADGKRARLNGRFGEIFALDREPDPEEDWLSLLFPDSEKLALVRAEENLGQQRGRGGYSWQARVETGPGQSHAILFQGMLLGDGRVLHILEEVSGTLLAQRSLARRLAFEKALTALSRSLLASDHQPKEALNLALGDLREAIGVCRVYVYRNCPDAGQGLCYSALAEAVAPGVGEVASGQAGLMFSYQTRIPRWRRVMSEGGSISGLVENFPAREREILEAQGVKQILVFPLWAGRQWLGFMGFDDTTGRRIWSQADAEALEAAAALVGAYLWRQAAVQEAGLREKRFRHVVEHAIEGIFILQDGVFKFVNPFGAFLFEAPAGEIVGSAITRFNHPDDREILLERNRCRIAGEPVNSTIEHRIITATGRVKQVVAHGTAMEWEGAPANMVFVRDVTEQRAAEKERLDREKMLSAVQVAGAVCHELNQPLQVIRARVEILLMDPELDSRLAAQLRSMVDEADRMADITRRLSKLTKLKTKPYLGDWEILDLERSSS